jgi:hypothetical protein
MKPENESTPWMTASQFGRHRGVSRQYVAKMIKSGLLPMKGRLIDVVKADALLADRPDAGQAEGSTATRYAEARTIRTIFQAKLARLEFETWEGRLIEREAARERIAEHMAAIGQSLDRFIDSIAPAIAQERDAKKLHAMLRFAIIAELHRLSAIVSGRADTGAPPEA